MLILTPAKNAVEVLPGYFANLEVRPTSMKSCMACTRGAI